MCSRSSFGHSAGEAIQSMRLRHPSSHPMLGFSLLEFAMGLPALLFTVLATLDVASILQARSALQQATTTSLRCVYPVDGACSAVSGDERTQFFNYYTLPPAGDDSYIYRRVDLSGTASFFQAPKHEMRDFHTRVLGNVHFDMARATYHVTGSLNGFRVAKDVPSVRNLGVVPYLEGLSARTPNFHRLPYTGTFPEARSGAGSARPDGLRDHETYVQVRAGDRSVTLLSNQTSPSSWESAYRFTLRRPPFLGHCEGSDCESLTSNATRVAFHLKGSGTSDISGGCGAVALEVRGSDGYSRDLGGQFFHLSSNPPQGPLSSSLNFYPRGVPALHVHPELRDSDEFRLHGSITLQYETEYQVRIRMLRGSGEGCSAAAAISWSASDLNIYLPYFSEETATITCQDPVFGAEIPADYVCRHPETGEELVGSAPRLDLNQPVTATIDQEVSGAFSPLDAFDRAIRSQFPDLELTREVLASLPFTTDIVRTETPQSFAQTCPSNRGVPEEPTQVPGATPEFAIRSSASALSLCPADPRQIQALERPMELGAIPTNVRWTEATQVIAHAPVVWTKWNCSVESPGYAGLPAELTVYPREKLRWTEQQYSGVPNFEVVPTGRELAGNPEEDPSDPAFIKATNPLFQCDELTIGRFLYDDRTPDIDRGSLFVGVRDNIDACPAGEILRSAAESSEIPEALRLQSTMFFRPGLPIERNRVETSEAPSDPCVAFQVREGEVAGMGTLVPGGPFTEGEIPAACQSSDARCRRVFAHFGAGAAGETRVLTERAEELGTQELFAAAPWTARSCGEVECGSVTVEENSPVPGMVSATAATKVRLTTLLGREITLSHTHRERLEVELAH